NGDSIYVNSGAATDHGELREGNREVGLTSVLLKLPVNGQNILLQDDREWLRTNGYLYAEGIRNTFDMAYAGNGDLFGVDNSGDRDDPDELNWIREGHHYGFPWRMGDDITPQQFTPYDPRKDPLLNPLAWGGGNLYVTFSNDSTYPPPPANVTFDDPVPSSGPDADDFRDTTTGAVQHASMLGLKIATFTPHRSPDGIVFDRDSLLSGDLKGGAFVISLSTSGPLVALGDTSQDLVLVAMTKSNDAYSATVTRLFSGFNSPLGIELDTNRLFVLETGLEAYNPSPKLWEIILPMSSTTAIAPKGELPNDFSLRQNYPNPFNPSTTIQYALPQYSRVTLSVYNTLGQLVLTLINSEEQAGYHEVKFDGKGLSSGVYFYKIVAGGFVQTKKLLLTK
ncbi:MAG TPA: T9SS type A sorting domain-containing protein, partial [Bacteroidota bacterium]|nr:T9SS type A sorting domain-containing protein [Bacteroidota bacterium]